MRFLQALGVKGYYGEGCPHPGVDMIDIKTYLAARTAFDPSLDTQSLVRKTPRLKPIFV
jgi:hypothetical protein|eukprot:COSAG06_NODE_6886_length_2729_cov_1.827376_2_plen_59_part_00